MGYSTNIIVFSLALGVMLTVLSPSSNPAPAATVIKGGLDITNMSTAFFNDRASLGAGLVGIAAGTIFFPNAFNIFLIPAAWIFSWFVIPSNLFDSASFGVSDSGITSFMVLIKLIFQISFILAVVAWFKGGSEP